MLQPDVGDDRRLRRGNDVGGVQPPAETDLDHDEVTAGLREPEKADGSHQLKLGRMLRKRVRRGEHAPRGGQAPHRGWARRSPESAR